jgi:hypothetical protein
VRPSDGEVIQMSRIVLGQSDGRNIELRIDILLRTHLLIWASTGGGKSWLIRRLAEQLFGKVPVIIVDREGEFSTLREKRGYVLVGQGGETPADLRSAKLVAEKLLELRASAVCDLYELKHETRHEWVKTFVTGLVDAPKRLWGPTVVIIDEAHLFCPEKGQGESPAYGAVADLAGQGRKRGFGIVLATQRLSKLSKNATGEMFNQAAGPTARQADRDRAAYEMGISDRREKEEFSEILRRLENGNFFFQGRAVAMDRVLVKVGPVETTHPEAGSTKFKAGPPPAPEEIKALLPRLADLPKAAEEKARSEGELREEVRRLKAELNAAKHAGIGPVRPVEVKVADPRATDRAVRETESRFSKALRERDVLLKNLAVDVGALAHLAGKVLERARQRPSEVPPPALPQPAKREPLPIQVRIKEPVEMVRVPIPEERRLNHSTDDGLTPKQQAILRVLWEFEQLGRTPTARSWVAARAEMAVGGGTFNNYIGNLRTRGLIEYAGGGSMQLTEAGRAVAPQSDHVLTTEALIESCLRLLTPKQQEMLKALVTAYPDALTNDDLAAAAGMTAGGGTFNNYRGALRSAGMAQYVAGKVKAADWLFVD